MKEREREEEEEGNQRDLILQRRSGARGRTLYRARLDRPMAGQYL